MKKYDILLYGATGAVGCRAARYLCEHAPKSLRWAIAGRDKHKLDTLAAELQQEYNSDFDVFAVLVEEVEKLVQKSRVVLSAAGPYSVVGPPIVEACIKHRADYLDVTGEVNFVRDMIHSHAELARKNEVTLVPCCGFDSIPADLGTFFAVEAAKKKFGLGVQEVIACNMSEHMSGGLGSGTVASLLRAIKARGLADPLSLQRDFAHPERMTAPLADLKPVTPIMELSVFGGMFFLAPGNSRVVRRSASIFASNADVSAIEVDGSKAYVDAPFCYQEFICFSKKFAAVWNNIGFKGFLTAMKASPILDFFLKKVERSRFQPKARAIAEGKFLLYLIAKTSEKQPQKLVVQVRGMDPGFTETAKMLVEAGLLLALHKEKLPVAKMGGGFWTPSTAFGKPLIDKLIAKGISFQVMNFEEI
ncbi:MAG: saccharopine dehydrogenase NADP-binding domain-containing protein [Zetaproteobacteria bacterium]|nr:saccharopine dehydrogenase NADP-binding domain-containing protein [Zetaproteobacteria bacterium]